MAASFWIKVAHLSSLVLAGAILVSCAAKREVHPNAREWVLLTAEQFLQACDGMDGDERLSRMMTWPFIVAAPCKGGDFASIEQLKESSAWSAWTQGLSALPRRYSNKSVIGMEEYVAGFGVDVSETNAERSFVETVGADTYVACLGHGGAKDGGIAVFVRELDGRYLVRGLGMLPPAVAGER